LSGIKQICKKLKKCKYYKNNRQKMSAIFIQANRQTSSGFVAELPEVFERAPILNNSTQHELLTWTDASGNKQTFKVSFEGESQFTGFFDEGAIHGFGILLKAESTDEYMKHFIEGREIPVVWNKV
jgi:hypothetical protein